MPKGEVELGKEIICSNGAQPQRIDLSEELIGVSVVTRQSYERQLIRQVRKHDDV
ncbi:hypothetical protein [Desulfosporosinus sp. Sb-LF]|uniref:hypothetical protein n=1 Tax=Desulfosporosinus sp. Sb-LF TaxID=2560027 RepID=UPI0018EE610F|nr:hypothetical protein [Desulfosporosinus sp. Sb-LF]